MKSNRFTEEQILGILKQAKAGMKIVDLCRIHGISDATFYNWRTKYGGMEAYAQNIIEAWRQDYNSERPHSSLNDMTPEEFASRFKEQQTENTNQYLVQSKG